MSVSTCAVRPELQLAGEALTRPAGTKAWDLDFGAVPVGERATRSFTVSCTSEPRRDATRRAATPLAWPSPGRPAARPATGAPPGSASRRHSLLHQPPHNQPPPTFAPAPPAGRDTVPLESEPLATDATFTLLNAPRSVPAGGHHRAVLAFEPRGQGAFSDVLLLRSAKQTLRVHLRGCGVAPEVRRAAPPAARHPPVPGAVAGRAQTAPPGAKPPAPAANTCCAGAAGGGRGARLRSGPGRRAGGGHD